MATNVTAEQGRADSTGIAKVWKANPTLILGKDDEKVTLKDYQTGIKAVNDINDGISDPRNQRTALINDRDTAAATLSGFKTRALSAIRGIHGPDSTEYDQAGGTPPANAKSPRERSRRGRRSRG